MVAIKHLYEFINFYINNDTDKNEVNSFHLQNNCILRFISLLKKNLIILFLKLKYLKILLQFI